MAAAAARSLAIFARAAAARSAPRVPTRRWGTTSGAGAASGAGPEEWGKADLLADQLVSLTQKTPTEAEMIKLRDIGKQMSELFKRPLTKPLSNQDVMLLSLQKDVNKLKDNALFHTNIAYTFYGIFGCFGMALMFEIISLEVKVENVGENANKEKRLTQLEAKVALINKEANCAESKKLAPTEGSKQSICAESNKVTSGWFDWLKSSSGSKST